MCLHLNNSILCHNQRSLVFTLFHGSYPFLSNLNGIKKAPSNLCQVYKLNADHLTHRFLCTLQTRLISVFLLKMINKLTGNQNKLSLLINFSFNFRTRKRNSYAFFIIICTIEYILKNANSVTLADYKDTIQVQCLKLKKIDPLLYNNLSTILC